MPPSVPGDQTLNSTSQACAPAKSDPGDSRTIRSAPASSDPQGTREQIRGSTLILVGRGLSVGMNFLTQVLAVRYLVKEDYGALAYALAIASFFGQFSRIGLDKAVQRFAAIEDERGDHQRLFGTLVFAAGSVVGIGSGIAVVVHALGDSVGPELVTNSLSLHLLLIVIALAPITALDHVLQSIFAVFSKPQLIFFRKYVVGPSLKLAAVLLVVLAAGDARALAWAHLVAGLLGMAIGASLAVRVLRERGLLSGFQWSDLEIRVRELLKYSLPMAGSDLVLLMRGMLVVVLLEYLHGTEGVADFRSVLPVARLNAVVLTSFSFLFVPAVARMAEGRSGASSEDLNDMYWRSTGWVALLTLPVFLVTVCFALPMTVLMFGERYASAAPVLAVLAAGTFVHSALAMNSFALKAMGRVSAVMKVDAAAFVFTVILTVLLVARYGALGGAVAVAVAAVAHTLLYQVVLARITTIRLVPRGFGPLYGAIGTVAAAMFLLQRIFDPPIWVGVPVAALCWLAVLVVVASRLEVEDTFPELLRVPVIGGLLAWSARR